MVCKVGHDETISKLINNRFNARRGHSEYLIGLLTVAKKKFEVELFKTKLKLKKHEGMK